LEKQSIFTSYKQLPQALLKVLADPRTDIDLAFGLIRDKKAHEKRGLSRESRKELTEIAMEGIITKEDHYNLWEEIKKEEPSKNISEWTFVQLQMMTEIGKVLFDDAKVIKEIYAEMLSIKSFFAGGMQTAQDVMWEQEVDKTFRLNSILITNNYLQYEKLDKASIKGEDAKKVINEIAKTLTLSKAEVKKVIKSLGYKVSELITKRQKNKPHKQKDSHATAKGYRPTRGRKQINKGLEGLKSLVHTETGIKFQKKSGKQTTSGYINIKGEEFISQMATILVGEYDRARGNLRLAKNLFLEETESSKMSNIINDSNLNQSKELGENFDLFVHILENGNLTEKLKDLDRKASVSTLLNSMNGMARKDSYSFVDRFVGELINALAPRTHSVLSVTSNETKILSVVGKRHLESAVNKANKQYYFIIKKK